MTPTTPPVPSSAHEEDPATLRMAVAEAHSSPPDRAISSTMPTATVRM